MPAVLATANESVIANEKNWEVSESFSLALNVSSAEVFFFIGKYFIGEKYKLPVFASSFCGSSSSYLKPPTMGIDVGGFFSYNAQPPYKMGHQTKFWVP